MSKGTHQKDAYKKFYGGEKLLSIEIGASGVGLEAVHSKNRIVVERC